MGLSGKREMAEEFRVLLLGEVCRPTAPSLPASSFVRENPVALDQGGPGSDLSPSYFPDIITICNKCDGGRAGRSGKAELKM